MNEIIYQETLLDRYSFECLVFSWLGQDRVEAGGYFETHGFAFLVYHNNYLVGKRGGLQMFLHDKLVADAGEVFCVTSEGRPLSFDTKKTGDRMVDLKKGLSIIPEKIIPLEITDSIICSTDGNGPTFREE